MTIPTTPSVSAYRADIDGLRAIAILAVIIFHINKSLIPGGFAGVDIFFVISGFLISLHILKDVERGKFSLLEFYRRRVKRLALPLFVVVAVTMLAAAVLMVPSDFKHAADSALYALLSLANLYFWLFQDTSYFAADSNSLPLLHLWSLGVEEQFYIFWPLLLMFTYRRTRTKAFVWIASIATLASFAFGEFWFQHDASFTYYMLPARAGELLIGALVAMLVLRDVQHRIAKSLTTPMAVTGLLLVIISLLWLNEDQVFPGVRALLPTLGAALLILAGHCGRNRVTHLLQFEPLVWIGLISYSAYLWHWPLLAMLRYEHVQIGLLTGSLVFGATIWLAFLSYMLVEEPARFWDATVSRIFIFQYIAPACLIAVLVLTGKVYLGQELAIRSYEPLATPSQTSPAIADPELLLAASSPVVSLTALAASATQAVSVTMPSAPNKTIQTLAEIDTGLHEKPRAAFEFDYVCQREKMLPIDTKNKRCILGGGDLTATPHVLLWGDSHAAHYIGVVASIAKQAGFSFRNIALDACPPLLDDPAPYVVAKRLADCRASMEAMSAAVSEAEVVIISATWSDYAARSSQFLAATFATIQSLTAQGKLVVIMAKAPVIMSFDAHCQDKAKQSGIALDCQFKEPLSDEVKRANATLKAFTERTPNVAYFDVEPYLCKDGMCSAGDAMGNPIYYDAGHISILGSWKIGDSIVRQSGVPKAFSGIVPWLNQAAKNQ